MATTESQTPSSASPRGDGPHFEPALAGEWDACHLAARDTVVDTLRALGVEPAALDHVARLRLYYRSMFLLSCWADDAATRRTLTTDLAMHVVSMKLLDDLMDADSGLDAFDLGISSLRLLLLGTERLSRHGACRELLQSQERHFDSVCSGQLRCKREPATDLESWLLYARDYGGRFLSAYGRFGGLAAGLGERASIPESFAWGFGMIITIADDLTDHVRHGERIGNLGAMLIDGVVGPEEVESVLEDERARACDAAAALPTAYDLRPVVDVYADDIRRRIMPRLLAGTFVR
ncbi:MAG: Moenomycin biosynthesis protein MoeN5 [Acidobacteriota bacterium]